MIAQFCVCTQISSEIAIEISGEISSSELCIYLFELWHQLLFSERKTLQICARWAMKLFLVQKYYDCEIWSCALRSFLWRTWISIYSDQLFKSSTIIICRAFYKLTRIYWTKFFAFTASWLNGFHGFAIVHLTSSSQN